MARARGDGNGDICCVSLAGRSFPTIVSRLKSLRNSRLLKNRIFIYFFFLSFSRRCVPNRVNGPQRMVKRVENTHMGAGWELRNPTVTLVAGIATVLNGCRNRLRFLSYLFEKKYKRVPKVMESLRNGIRRYTERILLKNVYRPELTTASMSPRRNVCFLTRL